MIEVKTDRFRVTSSEGTDYIEFMTLGVPHYLWPGKLIVTIVEGDTSTSNEVDFNTLLETVKKCIKKKVEIFDDEANYKFNAGTVKCSIRKL